MRGKASPSGSPCLPCRDHPRVCGEKNCTVLQVHCLTGSPPRMRGKVPETYRYVAGYGITPAYAGKRVNGGAFYVVCWDHPRVCGEKFFCFVVCIAVQGSPPRMRGKVRFLFRLSSRRRITPAYAGKSCPLGSPAAGFWDHPRVCGEKPHIQQLEVVA